MLHRFFAGTASFEEEEAVCNWAETSEANQKELIKERKCFDVFMFHGTVRKEEKATSTYRILPAIQDMLKVAAAIAILVVSALHIYSWVKPEEVIAFNKIVVPPGQRVNLTLSDGTTVWLNARTELTYPAAFTDDIRKVTLEGEGYFEVTKDTKRPFIVETAKCDINVLGTKFNVAASSSTDVFSAALMEGSIKIRDKTEASSEIILSPMQKAEWKDGKFKVDPITESDSYRWKEGLICFDNTLFTDLMEKFEKTYDIRIVVSNPKMKTYRCSGKFRVSDGLDFILHVLNRNAHFSFERSDDNATIYIK